MNKGLKNKGLGSWFCLAAALVALITGIVFLLTQATAAPLGHSGTMAGVVLLVGAAASLVFFFVSVPFSALIQAVIYNIALYLVVVQLYFVFADVINHVTFAGGNAGLCVFYMVGTFIACLLSVIACFCKQTKTGEAKATGKQFAAAGAVVVVAAVCVGGFSLQSSSLPSADNAEVAPDAAQTSADGPVMNYNDNEYVSKTLDDLIAIPQETWEAKEPNGEVAYFFEGQYTEGFSTVVDPACLDMYCYTDGSMWGSFSGPSTSVGGDSISHVYGYWYNYDENGEKKLPYIIHRTSLGCYERTLAYLIETYAGALPTWMAPEQVRFLPVTDRAVDYCKDQAAKLTAQGYRVTVDTRSEKIGKKIRDAQMEKIPYMLVVGDRDIEAGTVSPRHRADGDLGAMSVDEFSALLKRVVDNKEQK